MGFPFFVEFFAGASHFFFTAAECTVGAALIAFVILWLAELIQIRQTRTFTAKFSNNKLTRIRVDDLSDLDIEEGCQINGRIAIPDDAKPKEYLPRGKRIWRTLFPKHNTRVITYFISALLAAVACISFYCVSHIREADRIKAKATEKILLNEVRNIVYEKVFDPQPHPQFKDVFLYEGKPPYGIEKFVRTGNMFQDFSKSPVIQRLWADPDTDSYIKAHRKPCGKNQDYLLEVPFYRAGGNGCDVTIKPLNNQALHIEEKYRYLILELERGECDHDKPLAFHLRFVDGRGNQWVWGRQVGTADSFPSCHFSLDTSKREFDNYIQYHKKRIELQMGAENLKGAPGAKSDDWKPQPLMKVVKDFKNDKGEPGKQLYVFDLTDRTKWTYFSSDTGNVPELPSTRRFDTIIGIVIEPGIWCGDEHKKSKVISIANPQEHKRFLADSPKDKESVLKIISIKLM